MHTALSSESERLILTPMAPQYESYIAPFQHTVKIPVNRVYSCQPHISIPREDKKLLLNTLDLIASTSRLTDSSAVCGWYPLEAESCMGT